MSLYNGPARGGNRGGKDQFNWEEVKNAPDREYYLGHSVKASAGRWQKGKDILWYTREKKDDQEQQLREELQAIKDREEDLMLEAMGMKPKVRAAPKAAPSGQELELLMRKARGEGGGDDEGPPEPSADAMPGLGFSKADDLTVNKAAGESHEVMPGTGVPPTVAAGDAPPDGGGGGGGDRLTPAELAVLEEAEKAAAKRAKKAGRKAKKLAKQVRKEEKASAKKEAKRARKVALPPPPPLPPMASERRESPAEVDRQRDHDGRPQEGNPKREGDSHRRGGDFRSGSQLDSDRRHLSGRDAGRSGNFEVGGEQQRGDAAGHQQLEYRRDNRQNVVRQDDKRRGDRQGDRRHDDRRDSRRLDDRRADRRDDRRRDDCRDGEAGPERMESEKCGHRKRQRHDSESP